MALTLTPAQYDSCARHYRSLTLLDIPGAPTVDQLLLGGVFTCIGQALITGICLQHLMTYFVWQKKRDPTLARWGIALLGLIVLTQMAISLIQVYMLIDHHSRFTEVLLIDLWFNHLSSFCSFLIFPPVLLHFTFQAFVMWEHSMIVLLVCLAGILPSFIMGMTSMGFGLSAPWGFHPLTDDEFIIWSKEATYLMAEAWPLDIASRATLLESTLILAVFITWGILRHRNGFRQMDSAISRIVFVCGESLLPIVLVASGLLVGAAASHTFWGILLSRVCSQLGSAIFFFSLILSLVSRERVATILAAEPVRAIPTLAYINRSDAHIPMDGISPTMHAGGNFEVPLSVNWSTLTAETMPSKFVAPDFVDITKIPSDGFSTQTRTMYNSNYSSVGNRSHATRSARSSTLPTDSGDYQTEEKEVEGTSMRALSIVTGAWNVERRRSSAMSLTIHDVLRRGPGMLEGGGRARRTSTRT